jgi:hypothetical protein
MSDWVDWAVECLNDEVLLVLHVGDGHSTGISIEAVSGRP